MPETIASKTVPSWTGEERAAVNRLVRRVRDLGLGPVAILFLESARPLNFVGSQVMHFLAPMVHAFGRFEDYEVLARLLEDRESIGRIVSAIERVEEEARDVE